MCGGTAVVTPRWSCNELILQTCTMGLLLMASLLVPAVGLIQPSPDPTCSQPPKFEAINDFGNLCMPMERVCIDQGVYILHSDKALSDPFGLGLPNRTAQKLKQFLRHASINNDTSEPVYGYGFSDERELPMRLATPEEYVREKGRFSSCTSPLIIYQHWWTNYAEFFARSISFLHYWSGEGQMKHREKAGRAVPRNATIILAPPLNLPLLPYHRFLLAPFTDMKVTSLASFSSRLPHEFPSQSTFEKKHVRCFEQIHICQLQGGRYPGMWEAAQKVAEFYAPKLPASTVFSGGDRVLKVLFEKRKGMAGTRQVLNLDELVADCNSHVGWELDRSRWDSVECRSLEFGDHPLKDISVLKVADVFITMHGAGTINALFMREGSAFLEMRPFEFGTLYKAMAATWGPPLCHQNDFKIRCWYANFDEPDSWKMGAFENNAHREVKGDLPNLASGMLRSVHESVLHPYIRSRDRNMIVKMTQLQHMIKRVTDPKAATLEGYKKMWEESEGAAKVAWTYKDGKITDEKLW